MNRQLGRNRSHKSAVLLSTIANLPQELLNVNLDDLVDSGDDYQEDTLPIVRRRVNYKRESRKKQRLYNSDSKAKKGNIGVSFEEFLDTHRLATPSSNTHHRKHHRRNNMKQYKGTMSNNQEVTTRDTDKVSDKVSDKEPIKYHYSQPVQVSSQEPDATHVATHVAPQDVEPEEEYQGVNRTGSSKHQLSIFDSPFGRSGYGPRC